LSRIRKFRPIGGPDRDPVAQPPDTAADAGEERGAPPSRSRAVRDLTRRLEEILESAERTAEEIESEAEIAAKEYADERRRDADREREERLLAADREAQERTFAVLRLETALRGKARAVLSQAQELVSTAEAVLAALPPVGHEPGESPLSQPSEAPQEAEGPPDTPEGLRTAGSRPSEEPLLRAAHLAVAGTSRRDIEATLRAEFGIDSPEELVDEILGVRRAG
jgi:hypothetical protein